MTDSSHPDEGEKIPRGHPQQFHGPLRQSFKHTKALAGIPGLPREKVFSRIAFVGDAKLKRPSQSPLASSCRQWRK